MTADETQRARVTLRPGMTLGRYRVDRRLGAGGMGEVWEAHHELLGRRVAMKSLHPHLADDPVVLQRFVREGQAAAYIAHPHVVPILDVGIEQDVPILVMDFLDGPNLAQVFAERGRLPVADLLGLMLPVIAAVAAAHDGGIVHRDLKPENIVVTRDRTGRPHPVVVDFGISRQIGHEESVRLTATGAIIGTPAYMSPEQARGESDVGFAADQYALGAILFHGLTGQRPVEGGSLLEVLTRIVRGEHLRPIELLSTLDPRLDDTIMRAMAPRSDERFQSVRTLGAALLPFADHGTRSALAPELARAATTVLGTTPAGGEPRVARRRPALLWATVAATVVALGMGAMAVLAPPRAGETATDQLAPAPDAASVPVSAVVLAAPDVAGSATPGADAEAADGDALGAPQDAMAPIAAGAAEDVGPGGVEAPEPNGAAQPVDAQLRAPDAGRPGRGPRLRPPTTRATGPLASPPEPASHATPESHVRTGTNEAPIIK